MRLYRVWLEDYEVSETNHSSSVGHTREAEGSYGYEASSASVPPGTDGDSGKGKGKGKGGKPKTSKDSSDKTSKVKSEDQLVRAVLGLFYLA